MSVNRPKKATNKVKSKIPKPITTLDESTGLVFKKILFSHIPKTAGTSLREELIEALGQDEVLWLGVDFGYDEIKNPTKKMLNAKVIGGHYSIQGFPSIITNDRLKCSVIREPIARVKSLFNYIKSSDHHPHYELVRDVNLLEAIRNIPEFRNQCINAQCSFLGNYISENVFDNNAEPIIEKIIKHELFLTTVENIDVFYRKIAGLLGFDYNKVRKANKVRYLKSIYEDSEENKEAEDAIRSLNWEDNSLYNFVRGMESLENSNKMLIRRIAMLVNYKI